MKKELPTHNLSIFVANRPGALVRIECHASGLYPMGILF